MNTPSEIARGGAAWRREWKSLRPEDRTAIRQAAHECRRPERPDLWPVYQGSFERTARWFWFRVFTFVVVVVVNVLWAPGNWIWLGFVTLLSIPATIWQTHVLGRPPWRRAPDESARYVS